MAEQSAFVKLNAHIVIYEMTLAICEKPLRASDTLCVKMLKIGQFAGNLLTRRESSEAIRQTS